MHEDAQKIFDYLPTRRDTLENDYVNHLWQAFSTLDEGEAIARPFAIMPFHLLFMMSIQYKVLRIYREQNGNYKLKLTPGDRRHGNDILAPKSPFAIAYLLESRIVDFLEIAGLSTDDAQNIKKLIISYRNDKIAHAKGYIEQNLETKIMEYFDWLEVLQNIYHPMNQNIADFWLSQIQTGDDIEQFLETRFLDSCFTPRDFGDIIGTLLKSQQIDFDQSKQIVSKGLELAYEQTISVLRTIAKNDLDDGRKSNALRVLDENGELDKE